MIGSQGQTRKRILIVNDSLYISNLLYDILASTDDEILRARNGLEALDMIDDVDLVLLDLEMPKMDGFTLLDKISDLAIPVIVTSSYNYKHVIEKALEKGAIDFICINEHDIGELSNILLSKVRFVSKIKSNITNKNRTLNGKVVVIGASAGAPKVLGMILSSLPRDLDAAVLIVQHMPKGLTDNFINYFKSISNLPIKIAKDNDVIKHANAFIAPADYHMVVEPNRIILDKGSKHAYCRPSINVTMLTAACSYGSNTVGVLLSGMGYDGAFGMKAIKSSKGITIAQDEQSSLIFGMAKAAYEMDAIDIFAPADRLADTIVRSVRRIGHE